MTKTNRVHRKIISIKQTHKIFYITIISICIASRVIFSAY